MKQSLISKGQHILRCYQNSKDGIAVWKQLLETYCYNGDVVLYISEQQLVLCELYHDDYPGQELGFLEAYETAFSNIDAVSDEPLHSEYGKM